MLADRDPSPGAVLFMRRLMSLLERRGGVPDCRLDRQAASNVARC
jgi:hypothetical protein